MIQPKLTPEQDQLLLNCLIDFRGLLSQKSELIKLCNLHNRIKFLQDLDTEDIVFVNGILETLIRTYKDRLSVCDKNPGKYPDEIRRHYISKIVAITDLKPLFNPMT